jgi:SEL1 protein
MYEHGVGLKRDLHLAKRYYDMALAAAPEAVLPIRLALGHVRFFVTTMYLSCHREYF